MANPLLDSYTKGGGSASIPKVGANQLLGHYVSTNPVAIAEPRNTLETKLVSSFRAIDPARRAVTLKTFQTKAKAGDKDAARKLELLSPHLDAPAPATPDYTPKDFGSKLGATLYNLGKGAVESAKSTGQTIATAPHALNAAGIAVASAAKASGMPQGQQRTQFVANSKQKALNEIQKTPYGQYFGKTVQENNQLPAAKQLAQIGGKGLEDILNISTLGEGTIAKQAGQQVLKRIASKDAVQIAAKQAVKNPSGYIRNLASGQFSRTAIHPDDASVMAAFIDHARGITKLAPTQAQRLELDASRIAEHYNIGGKATTTVKLANAFDKVLSGSPEALRSASKIGEAGKIGLPQGLKPTGKLVAGTAGQRLVSGAKLGAGYGVAQAGQEGLSNPADIAKTVGTSAATGGALALAGPAIAKGISKTAQGLQKWVDSPISHVAEERVRASGKDFGSQSDYVKAIKAEETRIKQDPNQVQAIGTAYKQGGFKGLTAETGKPGTAGVPVEVPVQGVNPSKGNPLVQTQEQAVKGRAVAASTKQNLSSRVQQYEQGLQSSIKGIEDSGGYQKILAESGGDKVIANEHVLKAAKELGPLDEQTILNAKPLDKIDTVTLVRAKATLDAAAKDFTDAWQSGKYTDSQLTRMSKHISGLEAGYKIMSAEPGRATQIQSTFIDEAFKRAQKLKSLMEETKGATPEIRNQRIAQDLADFDKKLQQAKQSGVFTAKTLAKVRDVVTEYATASKLTSPFSHANNFISNGLNLATRAAQKAISVGIGVGKGETNLGELKHVFGSIEGNSNAWKQFGTDIVQAFKPNGAEHFASKSEIKPVIPGKAGHYIRLPFNAMAAADGLFKSVLRDSETHMLAYEKAYQEGFRGDALASRVKELAKSPTGDIAARAEKEAAEYTFTDEPGKAVQAISQAVNAIPGGRLLVPFIRTPTSIAKFQARRSPLGVFSPKNWNDIKSGGYEQREAVARLALGTALTTSALLAVSKLGDNIVGAAPTDKGERDLFYSTGKKPYSIKIGNTWVQYNRIQPLGLYISQSVGLLDALKKGDSHDIGTQFGAFLNTTMKGLADLPFVTGVSGMIDAINNPDDQTKISKAFGNIATGLIPNVSRDIANAQDSTARNAKTISDQVKLMIPGLRQQVSPRISPLGGPQTSANSAFERGFLKVVSQSNDSKLTNALYDAQFYPQPAKQTQRNVKLTDEQFQKFQDESGQLFATKLEKALRDSSYQGLDQEQKQRTLSVALSDARSDTLDDILGKQAKKKAKSQKIKRY